MNVIDGIGKVGEASYWYKFIEVSYMMIEANLRAFKHLIPYAAQYTAYIRTS